MNRTVEKILRIVQRARLGLFATGAVLLSLPALSAAAQSANDVILRFASGQDSMIGELTKFEDDKFFVNSTIGLVVIPARGVTCEGEACPDGTQPLTQAVAKAPLEPQNKRVILKAADGSMAVAGDFVTIENDEYVVVTAFGELRIKTDLVLCEGQACPDITVLEPADKTVALTSGGITMRGILVSFEDNTYVLDDNVMGTIRVSADTFACSGPGCP